LERNAFSPVTAQAMCIYGNPAYPLQLHLQQPFKEASPTVAEVDEKEVFDHTPFVGDQKKLQAGRGTVFCSKCL